MACMGLAMAMAFMGLASMDACCIGGGGAGALCLGISARCSGPLCALG